MNYDVIAVDPDGDGGSLSDAHHVLKNLDDIAHYVRPDTFAVVATHGSYDEVALEHLLKARPRYIGLVASQKRFQSVLEYLKEQGVDETDLQHIKAPAGLDIQAQQGDEIALSILAEIVQYRRSAQEADDWSASVEAVVEEIALAPTEVSQSASGIAFDPVCLMEVDIATARWTYEYEGTTYYFCAPGCKRQFRRNPQAFLQADSGTAVDPVCGMEVDIATAQHMSVYHGRTFYFCGEGCKATFDQKPEAYVTMMHHS
jgi:xanthine dehydrogenase accessory factor